jgi:hypothetical protein
VSGTICFLSSCSDYTSTGAPKLKVIHHGSRISTSNNHVNNYKKPEESKKNIVNPSPAVLAAHLDQSSWQAGNVLHNHFPEECERLMHGRYMIVNVSRPSRNQMLP